MDSKRQEDLIMMLAEICSELGWETGIPKAEGSKEMVQGLIVGERPFILHVLDKAFPNQYEVIAYDDETDGVVELPIGNQPQLTHKKKPTFH